MLHSKQFCNIRLIQTGTDDAQLTGDRCAAGTDIPLTGYIVKVDPGAVGGSYDTLCPKNETVCLGIQLGQGFLDLLGCKFPCSFHAPGGKHLVGMVVMVVMAMIVTAGAMTILMMVMVMIMMVVMIMIVVVIVAAAATVLVVVMVVIMMVVMIVVMIVAAAAAFLMVMMVMVVVFFFQFCQIRGNTGLALHCFRQLGASELIPGRCNDSCMGISFPEHFHSLI